MFGRAIDQTVRVDKRRGGGIVPIIIEKCVEYLRHFGKWKPFIILKITFVNAFLAETLKI